MTAHKEKEPDVVVNSATELGLAVYDNVGRILISGPIANAIHYGSVSVFYIEVGTLFIFLCLFISAYYPEIMLPFALIGAGGVGVCFLPLIFLHYIKIPLKLLFLLRAKYRKIYFKSGYYELFIELKSKDSRKRRGEWFKRFTRIKQEQALIKEQGDLQQREQEAEEHSRFVFKHLKYQGKHYVSEQEQSPDAINEVANTLQNQETVGQSPDGEQAPSQKKVELKFSSVQDEAEQSSLPSQGTKATSQAEQPTTESTRAVSSVVSKVTRIRIRGRARKEE